MRRISSSQTLPAREHASGYNPHTQLLKRLRLDDEAIRQKVEQLGGYIGGVDHRKRFGGARGQL